MKGITVGITAGLVFLSLCIPCQAMGVTLTGPIPFASDQPVEPAGTGGDVGVAGTRNAEIEEETIPETMIAGHIYPVTIRMDNIGTGSWTASKKIKLGAKTAAADMFGPKRVQTTGTVAPHGIATYPFTLVAPKSEGRYLLIYQMVKDGSPRDWFGGKIEHMVIVSGPSTENLLASEVFELTNTERTSRVLAPYLRNLDLNAIAATHSWAMAESHALSHNGAVDGKARSRLKWWPSAGENVAFVSSSYPGTLHTIADTMTDMWVNHDAGSLWGHRLNILDGEHTDTKTTRMQGHPYDWTMTGLGAYYGDCTIGGRLYSGWFVTQDFART